MTTRNDVTWTERETFLMSVPQGGTLIFAKCHALVQARKGVWRYCRQAAVYHIKGEGSYLLCPYHAHVPSVRIPHDMKVD